jgi:DNA-binding IclR family transcriptional regulator
MTMALFRKPVGALFGRTGLLYRTSWFKTRLRRAYQMGEIAIQLSEAQALVSEAQCSRSPSAARALNILEYFGTEGRPLRAGEIARIFNLCPSSTHQLLKTLVDMAFLTFNPRTKFYFPSSRLIAFATLLTGHYGGNQLTRLQSELQSETGETVWLVTLCDTQIQVVESLKYHELKGLKYPLDSIPGAVLLAQYSDDAVRDIIKRAVIRRDCPENRAAQLIRNSRIARDAGYASGSSVHREYWNISVSIPRRSEDIPMVISLSGEKDHVRSNEAQLLNIMNVCVKRFFG